MVGRRVSRVSDKTELRGVVGLDPDDIETNSILNRIVELKDGFFFSDVCFASRSEFNDLIDKSLDRSYGHPIYLQ